MGDIQSILADNEITGDIPNESSWNIQKMHHSPSLISYYESLSCRSVNIEFGKQ